MYYTAHELRMRNRNLSTVDAARRLREAAAPGDGRIDIFLSHSFRDAKVIYGLHSLLTARGIRVYVDWLDDRELDRSAVGPGTAHRLRNVMANSRSLIYATSRAATDSKWMPWELGYFDGQRGASRISVMPIEDFSDEPFAGQEYLGLYQSIEKVRVGEGYEPYAVRANRKYGQAMTSFAYGTGQFEELSRL
jgi:hypothetical protein